MTKRMLIDAAHPEETRVVVLSGNRLEEFDFETSTKKQIKGNIYLAKVTRVEPSLQAAFVEYGGNRHGFLAFSEIHPDYYRIPVADRQAALAADRAAAEREREEVEAEEEAAQDAGASDIEAAPRMLHESPPDQIVEVAAEPFEPAEEALADDAVPLLEVVAPAEATDEATEADAAANTPETAEPRYDDASSFPDSMVAEGQPESTAPDAAHDTAFAGQPDDAPLVYAEHAAEAFGEHEPEANGDAGVAHTDENSGETGADHDGHHGVPLEVAQDTVIETVGGDEIEEASRRRARPLRHYKIQEVIKRRQIMLVQVTKEERGNKGAALTTYLSLAGRYCVLMPNTPRGGGVSRKITSVTDRRRLKDLMSDLDVPDGMGVIVRTAGSERSKAEIKRDFEYLIRLWDEIRDVTLQSTAPALIYEEGNLIKRSIRDLYTRDLEEVIVDGEEGYKTAKAFMKMLMPSHAKRVKPYRDPSIPLFHRFQIESQIDLIHSPVVQLRSGGYIVINPTEALVAIDVNSGRSTKERNIEETALKTNLEAADEVARQLRLRDLAGLIVIDFIDMEEGRNQAAVERRLKEAMRNDRARIQLGRISPFGLLELSRQRLRPSLIEASTQPCPHCNGTGNIRSTESTALHILRAIEEEGMRRRSAEITVAVPTGVALYLLNQKRAAVQQAEARYGFSVTVTNDDTLIPPAFRLDRVRALTPAEIAALPTLAPAAAIEEDEDETDRIPDEDEVAAESETEEETAEVAAEHRDDEGGGRGRRRRRRRRGEDGRGDEARPEAAAPEGSDAFAPDGPAYPAISEEEAGGEEEAVPAATSENGEAAEAEGGAPNADGSDAERKRRRRGRRGGRRRRRGTPGQEGGAAPDGSGDGSAQELHGAEGQEFGDDGPEEYGEDEPGAAIEDVEPAAGVIDMIDGGYAQAAAAEWEKEHPGATIAETVEMVTPEPADTEAVAETEAAFAAPQATLADTGLDIAAIPVGEQSDREERFSQPVVPESPPAPEKASEPARAAGPVALPAAEPAVEEERHPVQYNIPEPHEVTGPPANPRRGWWRR